jgi:hypothetical protein
MEVALAWEPGMTHVGKRCAAVSVLKSGYPPDMIFEQQRGFGTPVETLRHECMETTWNYLDDDWVTLELVRQ